jgi:DNA-binding MarR family transcriptional regulator
VVLVARQHLCHSGGVTTPGEPDYSALLAFRTALRRFNRWSEGQAATAGLTHAQHQLLLAVKGHDDPRGPTIGEVADHLLLRHHSAVELVNRAQDAGLVERERDPDTQSVVHLKLTDFGALTLSALSELHLRELEQLAPTMQALVGALSKDEAADLLLMRQTR